MKPQWMFIEMEGTVHYFRLDLIVKVEDVLEQPRRTKVTMVDGFVINLDGKSAGDFMGTFRKWAENLP